MAESIKRVSFVGMGFVGLTTSAFFSSRGIPVTGIDTDVDKIQKIKTGIIPFYEADLEPLIKRTTQNNLLKLVSDYEPAVIDSDMTMIAVGTPSNEQGQINLKYIKAAAQSIGQALKQKEEWHLVVVKSTVVPGTARNVVGKVIVKESGKQLGRDFGLCTNPEFLREGSALQDSMTPDRVVIGEYNEQSGRTLENFYNTIYSGNVKIIRQNLETAEMVKYTANSFLALKISFANEIANICERIPGVDVMEVMKGVVSDFRINPNFFRAGLGFGGSCFPKDVAALLNFANEKGHNTVLLNGTLQVNSYQPLHAINILEKTLRDFNDKKIAILGLAFKKDTSDMRESPSIKLIKGLQEKGANNIFVCDPKAEKEAKEIFQNTVSYGTVEQCLSQASACIIATDWSEYTEIPPEQFQSLMIEPRLLLDGRRIYDSQSFNGHVLYKGIGIGNSNDP